jgi:hypothetical protein
MSTWHNPSSIGQETQRTPTANLRVDSVEGLGVVNGKAEVAIYKGRRAVRLVPLLDNKGPDGVVMALVSGSDFKDRTIEVDVAGFSRVRAPTESRGFIGVLFRARSMAPEQRTFICDRRMDEPMTNYAAMPAADISAHEPLP